MRLAGPLLLAASLGVHVALAAGLGSIPPRKRREVVSIKVSETKKPKTPPKEEPPPPPEPAKAPEPRPQKAKAAPAPAKETPPAPAAAAAPAGMDALPDFGVSMSGGGGLAVPAGGGGPAPAAAPAAAKTVARAVAPKNDCDEPPAKPKLVTSPTPPAYPVAERASGVSGKVRVEITVDEHGRITAVRVLSGLGGAFDAAAIAAARSAAFEAAVRCGKPSAGVFKVSFTFNAP